MECDKCQKKPATIHISQVVRRSSTGSSPEVEVTHHFCEECGRDFIQNTFAFKAATHLNPVVHREFHPAPVPTPPEPEPQIDASKRYDIYCLEAKGKMVVYRKALFKGVAALLAAPGGRIHYPDYVQLEQANGQSLFVPRSSIFKFCEPGATLEGEEVTG